jgi:hypothetical protein
MEYYNKYRQHQGLGSIPEAGLPDISENIKEATCSSVYIISITVPADLIWKTFIILRRGSSLQFTGIDKLQRLFK